MARKIAALIRHGDYHQLANVPSAHQPFALNKAGVEQAKAAATQLHLDLIWFQAQLNPVVDSSHLRRAWQSAELIVQELPQYHLSIESFNDLAERSVGAVANLTIKQIEALLEDDPRYDTPPENWKANSHYQLPFQGAESLMQSGVRVAKHIQMRMQQLPVTMDQNQIKLFVGHGAVFRHAAYHLGVMAFEDIAKLSMFHASPIYLELLKDGQWQHVGGQWKLRKKQDKHTD